MLKVTESVRDLFWKRCCGKVTSPCIKSWPLAAAASKQQQQWKTITIQWRWPPWCRCRSESPFTPSIISWALSVCIETRKKNNWASPLKSSKLWKQCADTRSGNRIRIILYLLHCICFLKKKVLLWGADNEVAIRKITFMFYFQTLKNHHAIAGHRNCLYPFPEFFFALLFVLSTTKLVFVFVIVFVLVLCRVA